ncbi:MAG: hypothetical protein NT061_07280 [Spirochaetes bacterium]|nr:hypothetical protein [Spirochaetota bacterium]
MRHYTAAIAGTPGAVGREMIKTLEQRGFPVAKARSLDLVSNLGKTIACKGGETSAARGLESKRVTASKIDISRTATYHLQNRVER